MNHDESCILQPNKSIWLYKYVCRAVVVYCLNTQQAVYNCLASRKIAKLKVVKWPNWITFLTPMGIVRKCKKYFFSNIALSVYLRVPINMGKSKNSSLNNFNFRPFWKSHNFLNFGSNYAILLLNGRYNIQLSSCDLKMW
jgi:hypothetical protein